MTNKTNVPNMPAGPELDRLVAVALGIDLDAECDGEVYNEDDQCWSCTKCGKVGKWDEDFGHRVQPYKYSQWGPYRVGQVIEALADKLIREDEDFGVTIERFVEQDGGDVQWRVRFSPMRRFGYEIGDGSTLALAVSRVAAAFG